MMWDEAVDKYLEYYFSLGNSQATVQLLRLNLRYLVDFCREQGRAEPRDVTDADVAAYQQSMKWRPGYGGRLLSESGVARNLEVMRAFFRWAAERRLVLLDPTRSLVVRRVVAPGRAALTADEVQAMLDVPHMGTVLGVRDRALLETLYGTGVRRRECFELNLDDLDLRSRTLTVKRGKGGSGRVIPLGLNLVHVLGLYLDGARPVLNPHLGEPALFLSRDGLRLGYHQIGQLVLVAARRAGLKRPVRPHDLRRALGTHLLQAGADLRKVQAILGHEVIDSTERYTRLENFDAAREFRDKHPRARRKPQSSDPPIS